jgi:YVTN family beta-propeller protein
MLYPNADGPRRRPGDLSRRRLLAASAAAGTAATAGCAGADDGSGAGDDGGGGDGGPAPTVFVFNTGDGTVSVVDAATDEVVDTRAVGLSSSFPSNQYAPGLTDDPGDSLWLNVGRGVRALAVGDLSETARVETGSGANWLERTPDGAHVVVSAREPAHRQFRIDADPDSDAFGEVTGRIDRADEGGVGDAEGPGPCDVTVHPEGRYAYVPDLFGDTLTVLDVEAFEVAAQVPVQPVGDGPSRPWMGTASWDGETLLVEHDEGSRGTESVWDLADPAAPALRARLGPADGLGGRPLTSEIGPDSETGYVLTPGTRDVTVVDLRAGEVRDRIDVGGEAFSATWGPDRRKLYVPVQTADEVAVLDHVAGEVTARIPVGDAPYGATAATVRPVPDASASLLAVLARLGAVGTVETTYCVGNCACGHRL